MRKGFPKWKGPNFITNRLKNMCLLVCLIITYFKLHVSIEKSGSHRLGAKKGTWFGDIPMSHLWSNHHGTHLCPPWPGESSTSMYCYFGDCPHWSQLGTTIKLHHCYFSIGASPGFVHTYHAPTVNIYIYVLKNQLVHVYSCIYSTGSRCLYLSTWFVPLVPSSKNISTITLNVWANPFFVRSAQWLFLGHFWRTI